MIGQTVSHYKITAKLGEGGMGVVYKAEDTSLGRPVALKFLAAQLIKDEEARKRFEREARAAAALQHPNICTIHEIGEAGGETFLAMAFIDGESLDSIIAKGPLPLPKALDIAQQIAKGLQVAHEKRIVHRDIKPANTMVDAHGHVTVMDFGLALLTEGSKLTQLDTKVGTVAYMSPEQAQGMEVDHRTDVWALGCVLYEMVSGRRPFLGHYDQALVYSIVNEPPEPLTGLRTGVPMELEFIVGKCLEKDAGSRYQQISDIAVDLRNLQDKLKSGRSTILRGQILSQSVLQQPEITAQSPAGPLVRYRVIESLEDSAESAKYLAEDTQLQRSVSIRVLPQSSAEQIERGQRRKQTALLATTAVAVILALAFAIFPLLSPPPATQAPLRRFAVSPPVAVGTSDAYYNTVAVSPDGRHVAFVEAGPEGRVWVQDLDQPSPRVIEGTEGAFSLFWSPGSDFIGFAAGDEVKRVPVQGGIASRICALPSSHFHGPSWSPDGEVIVFGSGTPHGLYEVPARGGTPKELIPPNEIDPSTGAPIGAVYWSHFLPSEAGARVVALIFRSGGGHTMAIQDLETGTREILGPGVFPIYSRSGHLVYQPSLEENSLWALPFSLETLGATGEAFPLVGNGSHATVADDQTLVYIDAAEMGEKRLVWIGRSGEKRGEVSGAHGRISGPVLSPDGRLVAVSAFEAGNTDVWVYDIARGSRTRLTTDPAADRNPVWSPAGDQVAFSSNQAGNRDIFLRQADGGGSEQILVDTRGPETGTDWSRDGRYILYFRSGGQGAGSDLWFLERKEDGGGWEPHPLLQTPGDQTTPKISPDGRYVAHVSNESGRAEVYVQPFPESGRRVTVSTNGGTDVRWSRDGRELFYLEGQTLVAVSVSTEGAFKVGEATRLFEHPSFGTTDSNTPFDVSTDGQQFILAEAVDTTADAPKPSIRIVLNWYEEFRGREKN